LGQTILSPIAGIIFNLEFMNLIEKYKAQIEAGLKEATERFLEDTSKLHLSPRWFNTDGILISCGKGDEDKYDWKIRSTQCGIGFSINVTEQEAEYIRFEWITEWVDFKRFRTQWLETNYPQIPRY
jgi:hypothetical protein